MLATLPLLLLAAQEPAADQDANLLLEPIELRALWIGPHDLDLFASRDRIAATMDRLAEIGFNAVIPTAWKDGRALFPSPSLALVATGETLLFPGRDVLGELVFEAHRAGLEVLPCIDGAFTCPLSGEGALKLSASKDDPARPDPSLADVRALAREFAFDLVRAKEIDGLVLIDGLPAVPAQKPPPGVASEFLPWRKQLRDYDPGLVVVWAALDEQRATPLQLGLLMGDAIDFLLLPDPSAQERNGAAEWAAAKPRRAGWWHPLAETSAPEDLLATLASARTSGRAGEVLGPFARFSAEDSPLAEALTQGVDAPYYARATLPWRGTVVWRPRTDFIRAQIDGGLWDDVDGPAGLALLRLSAGEGGGLSWTVRPEEKGIHELWVFLPPEAANPPELRFSLTTESRRVRRIDVDTTTTAGRGWVHLGRAILNESRNTDLARLVIEPGGEQPVEIGPLVALLRRRPESR